MKRLLLVIFMIAGAAPATAADNEMFDTGNNLHAICQGERQILCTATAVGHFDMMIASGFYCDKGAGVTKGQIGDVVAKYLKDNPAQRDQAAAYLSVKAFRAAFNCRRPPARSSAN